MLWLQNLILHLGQLGLDVWNAVPAKSKGHYSAWLKSISYSISYSIFGENRSSTRFFYSSRSFTDKCNRSFTRFYRSPTRYSTRCFIFHPSSTVWHTRGSGRRQGITCAHFADSACRNVCESPITQDHGISRDLY